MNQPPLKVVPMKQRRGAPADAGPNRTKAISAPAEAKADLPPHPWEQRIESLEERLLTMRVAQTQFLTRLDFLEVQMKNALRMVDILTEEVTRRARA